MGSEMCIRDRYRTDDISGTAVQNSVSAVNTDNIAREDYLEKRR